MRTELEIREAFDQSEALTPDRPFFLVGIGGAGMCPLAHMLARRGIRVRGSDVSDSPVIAGLREAGIDVVIGHDRAMLAANDQLVLSDAIMLGDSPEVAQANALGLPRFRRSQLLGWLLRDKRILAVTGTHGKTTTTGMLGAALRASGFDPTVVVGAEVPEFGSSLIEGSSEWAVVEACEAYDSFHDLKPWRIVLTNLELDHVDFHGTYERLRDSVVRFVRSMPADGKLLYAAADPGAREVAEIAGVAAEGYTTVDESEGELSLPGRHNRTNAAGALAAALSIGADRDRALQAICAFRGAERRLQVLQVGDEPGAQNIAVVDDYAHHPTEIRASIGALRERYAGRRLLVVFQPHLYSRTADLIRDFAEALDGADFVVMTDIYPAREDPVPGVSSARIVELLRKPSRYVPLRHLLPRAVRRLARPGDVVVGMGAGNIADFAPEFLHELRRPTGEDALAGAKLRIVVLEGGDSTEREVSLHSARAVESALSSLGHEVQRIDMSNLLHGRAELSNFSGRNRPDAVFLAVHGSHAEDGAIQGLLELLHLPYVGSGVLSSALAMDKDLAKSILAAAGIPVPQGILIDGGSPIPRSALPPGPWIVKPNAQGSTVGLSFVESEDDLDEAVARAAAYGREVLVETWIRGMELSVPVMGDRALEPVEIAPKSGRYDFASKYTPGATEEICPARLPETLLQEAKRLALQSHRALRCEGVTRTDMMLQGEAFYVLEVNTLPGLTETSLLPNSARACGIEMPELCQWMVVEAMRRHAETT